jgi:hypothetical protein
MNKVSGNLLRFFKVAQILLFIFGAIVRLLAACRNGPGSSPKKYKSCGRPPQLLYLEERKKERKKNEELVSI